MSNTKPEPLLSDEELMELTYVKEDGRRPSEQVRDFYEAARAKDAELIQQLVDACRTAYRAIDSLNDSGMGPLTSIEGLRAMSDTVDAVDAAEAAGFKPSDR
jgi:hypothetical protein